MNEDNIKELENSKDISEKDKDILKKYHIDQEELKKEANNYKKVTDSYDFTTAKNGAELQSLLGDNGTLWATAFSQITKKRLDIDIPKEYMVQWFSSCIEYSYKLRKWREDKEI